VSKNLASLLVMTAGAVLTLATMGCCYLAPHRTPEGVERWQSTAPPSRSVDEKAERYGQDLERRFRTESGLVQYRLSLRGVAEPASLLPDGCFHTGIYLASQSLRFAATGSPNARTEILRALDGLDLLHEVTGKRGLFARHALRGEVGDFPHAIASTVKPGYVYRGDVSKDQYAGLVCGLGVTLAVIREDEEVRSRAGRLALAVCDHLIANDLEIVDLDGTVTTHGNLRGYIFGFPIGVNALISLAIARTAKEASTDERYERFWNRLIAEDYLDAAYWAHFQLFGVGSRMNDNMSYLALCALALLDDSERVRSALAASTNRSWEALREDRNAFAALVHGAATDDESSARDARTHARRALAEFPDRKIPFPVDLTREGFDFPVKLLNSRKCVPRTTSGVPLYLRPVSSSYWAADPYALVGRLGAIGGSEMAGVDFLVAYWLQRCHDKEGSS